MKSVFEQAIATVCMFHAGKVEKTPHPLKDAILVSYEIIHKKDPDAAQRIKQKTVHPSKLSVSRQHMYLGYNVKHGYKRPIECPKIREKGSEVEGSAGGTRVASKAPSANEEQASKQISSQAPQHKSVDTTAIPQRGTKNQSNDGSVEMGSDITDHNLDIRESHNLEQLTHQDNKRQVSNRSKSSTQRDQDRIVGTKQGAEVGRRDESALNNSGSNVGRNLERQEVPLGHSPNEAIKIDKDKLKALAAMGEKRKEQRGEMALKKHVMDEDYLIERELENGIELAVEDDKITYWIWSNITDWGAKLHKRNEVDDFNEPF
ncbi:Cyclin-T1-4 [Glycine max]|nr:Cyclin-T1-4 [Glycine max]